MSVLRLLLSASTLIQLVNEPLSGMLLLATWVVVKLPIWLGQGEFMGGIHHWQHGTRDVSCSSQGMPINVPGDRIEALEVAGNPWMIVSRQS